MGIFMIMFHSHNGKFYDIINRIIPKSACEVLNQILDYTLLAFPICFYLLTNISNLMIPYFLRLICATLLGKCFIAINKLAPNTDTTARVCLVLQYNLFLHLYAEYFLSFLFLIHFSVYNPKN